ncbi:MAG: TolC family protein, partial [Bacteroidales bacterium]|nr:TolC family protein [Bacteroidales bacterium]
ARTYFYPALTLSATGGYSVTDLSYLFNAPMLALNIAGGLVQPILNYGQNKQRLRGAQADEEEYLITYRQKLLQASNEVVNSLHSYQMATEKMTIRTKQIESLEKSVDYTLELLKYTSNTNYTDVLTAEMNLLSAQLSGVGDKLQQLQSVVDLYQSLGGGWKN